MSVEHIRRAIRAGAFPVSNLATSERPVYRVSREALEAWLKSREIGPKPKQPRKKDPGQKYVSQFYPPGK